MFGPNNMPVSSGAPSGTAGPINVVPKREVIGQLARLMATLAQFQATLHDKDASVNAVIGQIEFGVGVLAGAMLQGQIDRRMIASSEDADALKAAIAEFREIQDALGTAIETVTEIKNSVAARVT